MFEVVTRSEKLGRGRLGLDESSARARAVVSRMDTPKEGWTADDVYTAEILL